MRLTDSTTAVALELEAGLHRPVLTDPAVTAAYSSDRCASVAAGTPAAVVLARSVDEVQTVMRVAGRHRIPVVPRGAGSGLSGGATALDGCIVLGLAAMDRIVTVDRDDLVAVVEPGVITGTLHAAAREVGLAYPPDPASAAFCTVGGNLATNAGGLCCVKYGVTRDAVLGIDVVLADGSLLRLGRRTLKNVVGLDLTSLLVGSEGTLGVIVGATLRLRPARPPAHTMVAFFATVDAAGAAISAIRSAVVPSLLELMDRATVRAVEAWQPQGLDTDAGALLVVQSDAPGDGAAQELATCADAARVAGAVDVLVTADPVEADLLLAARRLAFPALERLGSVLLDDVAVPCSRIGALVAGIEQIAARHGTTVGTFGHAGDGNMHPTIVWDGPASSPPAAVVDTFTDIVDLALALGGTVTGEHGVGVLKHRFLAAQLGDDVVRIQRAVRQALDPLGICNPGRAV